MGLLLKQTGHVTLFNTLSCPSLASSVYQKGNLSHAIMAENKGDEVLCTKKGGDQRALMKSDCAGRVSFNSTSCGGTVGCPVLLGGRFAAHGMDLEKGCLQLS